MKRFGAFLLALTLVIGCTAALADDAFTPMEEPFRLKVAMHYNESDLPGQTPETSIWNDWFKKYLNVELEWIWLSSDGGWTEKLNASLASGDIPDVLCLNSQQFREFLENDYIRPIDDAWDKYASGALRKMYENVNNDPLKDATFRDHLYVWYWSPVRIWDPAQNVVLTEQYSDFFASADADFPSFVTSDQDKEAHALRRDWWLQPKEERTRDDSVYSDWIWAWAYGMDFGGDDSAYALGLTLKDQGYTELDVNYGGTSTAGSQYASTINAYVST